MRTSFITLTLALGLTAMAQFPTCDPSCKNCSLYCNQGCKAPLDLSQQSCGQCLYCRRESSACGFAEVESSADPAFCAMCEEACHCYIDAICLDGSSNTTTSATPSSSAPAV